MSKLLDELELDGTFHEVFHSMQKTKEEVGGLPLLFEYKNVYGRNLYYPSCEKSGLLIKLTSHKSFTEEQICILQDIGFEIGLALRHAGRMHKVPFTRSEDEANNSRLDNVQ